MGASAALAAEGQTEGGTFQAHKLNVSVQTYTDIGTGLTVKMKGRIAKMPANALQAEVCGIFTLSIDRIVQFAIYIFDQLPRSLFVHA